MKNLLKISAKSLPKRGSQTKNKKNKKGEHDFELEKIHLEYERLKKQPNTSEVKVSTYELTKSVPAIKKVETQFCP